MVMKNCKDLTIEGTHTIFQKILTLSRKLNCIFGGSMYQELGHVSEFETDNGRIEVKNPKNVESIIYLTHLDFLIYSERLCSFRMSIAYTNDQYSIFFFISNNTKLTCTNRREGNKGSFEKLRYVRLRITLHFIYRRQFFFCISLKTFSLQLLIIYINK